MALIGKLLQLTHGILGIDSAGAQRTAVMIPEGASVQLVATTVVDTRTVDVVWNGRTFAVFTEDLSRFGKPVKSDPISGIGSPASGSRSE